MVLPLIVSIGLPNAWVAVCHLGVYRYEHRRILEKENYLDNFYDCRTLTSERKQGHGKNLQFLFDLCYCFFDDLS